jgi:hypothetical protein
MTFLAILLFLECVIMFGCLLVAAALAQQAYQQMNMAKDFFEVKKNEIMDFIQDKKVFVEKLENKVENSTLGKFLNLDDK